MSLLHLTPQLAAQILAKVDILPDSPDACWLWRGTITEYGYGQFAHKGKTWRAHRIVYFIFTQHDPGASLLCHKCDVRACCNPRHFFLGTHDDNQKDMARKGRAAKGERSGARLHPEIVKRGEIAPRAILTEKQVVEIRRVYNKGGTSARALGERYHVSGGTICSIVSGKNWAHLPVLAPPKTFAPQGAIGSENPRAKLAENDIREIRSLAKVGWLQREIAVHFNVSQGAIQLILSGKNWSHVK